MDQTELKNIKSDGFKSALGVVPQEVFLFSDSIGNNIKFGSNNPDISEHRLNAVCETADILSTIQNLDEGYDTILGERGVNLSGGQKQRVSIARALIRHPKLLVLDDCLSAVDTETEEQILNNLLEMEIKISHRSDI